MKKNINRIVAICLALVMCALLVPVQAEALSYSGSSSYRSGKYYTALTKVSLTGNQRTDIVNVAKSQVGYQEGSSSSQLAGTTYGGRNYTEYGRWYGMQDMWCAMFVSWCANVAGISTSIIPSHSYTPTGLNWFRNKGLAYSRATVASGGYTPQKGDIIYFKSARNSNITNHIGIVTSYSGKTVYTIEGNTSSATISTNGGAVAAKSYSISNTYIVYICKPSYKGTSISTGSSSSSSSGSGNQYATAYQMEVLRKIMYAVETGGQVYGNARYDDFTEAYTNTPEEHAITIGAGQWFATEAKRLLNTIRTQYPAVFAANDTAGIASDLDTKNWSTYKLSKTSAKAKCIQKIINTPEGRKCQDQLIDEQMVSFLGEARNLGVTEIKAMMMCANLRHLGGLGAVKRVLGKTKTPYTLDNIYAALQTDTGNQVGTFRSRNKKVYNWLKEKIG